MTTIEKRKKIEKQLIQKIDEHASLYRDPENGLAWVGDGRTGLGYSCHGNIDETGSVEGMKAQGSYGLAEPHSLYIFLRECQTEG